MIYLGIFAIGVALWMAYELWRAPLLRQDREDGPFITVRPKRKLSNLFKRKKQHDHSNNT